jgi:hypothetical protein
MFTATYWIILDVFAPSSHNSHQIRVCFDRTPENQCFQRLQRNFTQFIVIFVDSLQNMRNDLIKERSYVKENDEIGMNCDNVTIVRFLTTARW